MRNLFVRARFATNNGSRVISGLLGRWGLWRLLAAESQRETWHQKQSGLSRLTWVSVYQT